MDVTSGPRDENRWSGDWDSGGKTAVTTRDRKELSVEFLRIAGDPIVGVTVKRGKNFVLGESLSQKMAKEFMEKLDQNLTDTELLDIARYYCLSGPVR